MKDGDRLLYKWRKVLMQSRVRECMIYMPDMLYWTEWMRVQSN